MRKTSTGWFENARSVRLVDVVTVSCFTATVLVWAFIDVQTETQLPWPGDTVFLPMLGLLAPIAGLITGVVAIVSGKRKLSAWPAFLAVASSPLVATGGFVIGLAIAMSRFEALIYAGP
jgi:hypothetical protein